MKNINNKKKKEEWLNLELQDWTMVGVDSGGRKKRLDANAAPGVDNDVIDADVQWTGSTATSQTPFPAWIYRFEGWRISFPGLGTISI